MNKNTKKIYELIPNEYSALEKEEITRAIQEFSQLYAEIIEK